MKVLVACEFSGAVRRAFTARGHDAWSIDLLPSEDGSNHHVTGNVYDLMSMLRDEWDMVLVAHPPCTRLCNSGVRWLSVPPPGKTVAQMNDELVEGAALFSAMWNAAAPRICVENPIMHKYAKVLITNYEPPAQTVQPWWFGHGETKATSFWLRGLPPLLPTNIVSGRSDRVHMMSPGPNRWRERSRTYQGVADAMAHQWGDLDGLTLTERMDA